MECVIRNCRDCPLREYACVVAEEELEKERMEDYQKRNEL